MKGSPEGRPVGLEEGGRTALVLAYVIAHNGATLAEIMAGT